MQVRMAWLAMGMAIAATARVAAADCALEELGPELITRAGAKIPADGGILVGWHASTSLKAAAKGDPSQHAYKATAGGKTVSLIEASLAPGLTVYRPKPAVVGALSVKSLVDVTFEKAKGAALPAPDVSAVVLAEGKARYNATYTSVTASVAAVPDAAVALVLYAMADEEHVPLSFGTPAHDKRGATTVLVFEGAHNCEANPPAMRAPAAGDEVVLAWVDAFGRISPVSQPVIAK
jgi:hypothetical protein